MIKSVVLIHPPHPNSTEDCLDPPLGLAYLAATVRDHYLGSVDVQIVDLSGIPQGSWDIPPADLYGITVYAPSFGISLAIIAQCREANRRCKIAVGGAHPSAVPEQFVGFVDHVAIGMGEGPILDIIDGSESFIVKSAPRGNVFKLPAFDLVDRSRYKRRIDGKRSLPLLTTRGCPYKCAFCGLSLSHEGSNVLRQNPRDFIEQVQHYVGEYGVKSFGIQDDIFTMSKTRLREMLDGIRPLGVNFRCHGRAGLDDESVYEMLGSSGCSQVAWGIESGSQMILDRMNKQVSVRENLEVIQWAKKYGIDSRVFIIIGFPGETAETLQETMRFIDEADPDQYFVSSFVPYPGTDVWNNPEKYGITYIDRDFDNYYQVDKNGFGGLTIDTEWLSRDEFGVLEQGFRDWIRSRKMRGSLLDYEKR